MPRHRSADLDPETRDALGGPDIQYQVVLIHLLVGEPDKALDYLEPLIEMPYFISPQCLRADPAFESLRASARFKRLVEEGS